MKILQINKMYTPDIGGVETVVKQYAELMSVNSKVTVLCINKKFKLSTSREFINGVEVIRCSSFGTFFSMPLSLSFFLYFFRLKRDFDIIHIHEPFPLASLLSLFVKRQDKVCVTWHSDIIKQKFLKRIVELFQKRLCRLSKVIFTTSPNLLSFSDVISNYKEKVCILPLSIDVDNVQEGKYEGDYFLYLGRLSYYKGISVLLEAFEKSDSEVPLYIVGDGDVNIVEQINKHIATTKKDIQFINKFVSEDEKQEYLRNCKAFLFPSIQASEAFGIIQLEAMLQGKPVINTDLPTGVPYVSQHMTTGLTVKVNDSKDLKNAINLLARDKELARKLGIQARKRVIKEFSDSVILERLRLEYEKI